MQPIEHDMNVCLELKIKPLDFVYCAMLPPKSSTKEQVLINIENIRHSFENEARKLCVIIESIDLRAAMEKHSVVTRCGRKATAISSVNKSADKLNSKKLPDVNKENKGTVRHGHITRKQFKTTLGLKKSSQDVDLKIIEKFNQRNYSCIAKSLKENTVTLEPSINSRIKADEQNYNKNEGNIEQISNIRTRCMGTATKKTKDISEISTHTHNVKKTGERNKSIKSLKKDKIIQNIKSNIQSEYTAKDISKKKKINTRQIEVDVSIIRRSSPRKDPPNKQQIVSTNVSTIQKEFNNIDGKQQTDHVKVLKQTKTLSNVNDSSKENNNFSIIRSDIHKNEQNKSISKRCSPGKDIHTKEKIVSNISTATVKSKNEIIRENKNIQEDRAGICVVKDHVIINKILDIEQNNFVSKRTRKRDKEVALLVSKKVHDSSVKTTIHSIIKDRHFVKQKPLRLNISQRRLRKRNVRYFNESYEVHNNLEGQSSNEQLQRVPIYKKVSSDSENDNIKNKDIYKFTEDIFDKSDLYDKDTAKVMHLIEKAERNKAKRRLKAKETYNRRKNNSKFKNQFVGVEIAAANASNNNLKTYGSKTALNNGEAQKSCPKVQILDDVVVYIPSSNNKSNLIIENSPNKSLSVFDKLKAAYENKEEVLRDLSSPGPSVTTRDSSKSSVNQDNQTVGADQQVFEEFNSPALSVYTRITTPLQQNDENTSGYSLTALSKPVLYTSHIEPTYDLSNNYGFDEEEVNSPEQSILVHLNEVSRKLQKRTPWRNRLVVRNKRFLTVKGGSSLPNVDQELILDSTIVAKLSRSKEKDDENGQKTVKDAVQSNLDGYLGKSTVNFDTNTASLSTLFEANNLSPIKQAVANKLLLETPLNLKLIHTHRKAVKLDILQSTNMQSTPNITETISLVLKNHNSNRSQATNDLDNSYFGFITPTNKKNPSKENVAQNRSPSKLPMRLNPEDLERFRKKYVGKKERAEQMRRLEVKLRQIDNVAMVNEAPAHDSEDENNISDELPKLGLFDELLQEAEPEEDHVARKRCRKEYGDTTERIRRTKRRNKNKMSEFEQWTKKFNKMCKEVDKHKLYIE